MSEITDMLESKSVRELLNSQLAELAKSSAELKSAQNDLSKAQRRLSFGLLLTNHLIQRLDQLER